MADEIDRAFAGYGMALRHESDPPIPGEPLMSMADAKRIARGMVDAASDRAWSLECLLKDLLFCQSEQATIGGGPGWKEREAKAWAAAWDFFGNEI